MQKLTLFIRNTDNVFEAVAVVEVDGLTCGRAAWNSAAPDQHGTAALWEFNDARHIIVSPSHTLRIDSERYAIAAMSLAPAMVYLIPLEPQEKPTHAPLFPLGRVVTTPAALAAITRANQTPDAFLPRHERGDWGDVCDDDKRENNRAVGAGNRVLSAYETATGERLWIITEADRSATTLLLPEEY
jgi:hypothetical protein